MESDANQVFKFSRVLWFPVSVYAIGIGAAAVATFHAWTWIVALLTGAGDLTVAEACVRGFQTSIVRWVLTGAWADVAPAVPADAQVALRDHYALVFSLQCVGAYLIWSISSVALARIMAVRIARDQYISLREAFTFAWGTRFTSLLHAPCVIAPMAVIWLVVAIIGLVASVPWIGWIASFLLLPVTFLFTIVFKLIGITGILSLGLTPAAIATERRGTYDAIGKAYNYFFARPFVVIFYLLLLAAFVHIVENIVFDADALRQHVARLVTPPWASATLEKIVRGDGSDLSGFAWLCAKLHSAMYWILNVVVDGAVLSWISGAFTAMFMIFRKDVDGAEYTDVVESAPTATR